MAKKAMSNLPQTHTVDLSLEDCEDLLKASQRLIRQYLVTLQASGYRTTLGVGAPTARRHLGYFSLKRRPNHCRTMSQPRPPPPGNVLPGGSPALIPPQFIAPFQAAWERHAHDSAHRHPVFFTERLTRPPAFGIGQAPSLAMSPVAQGYVYQEGQLKATHASKL